MNLSKCHFSHYLQSAVMLVCDSKKKKKTEYINCLCFVSLIFLNPLGFALVMKRQEPH